MSNIVKKRKEEDVPMPNIMFPMMPEIMASAMPVPIPQMDWNRGIIPNFFHNIKLGQFEKATSREASIAGSKNRMVRANLDTIKQIMTFSTEVGHVFEEAKHNSKRREHEAKMWDLEEQTSQAGLIEQQIKNVLLQNEAKLSGLEFEMKNREYKKLIEGDEDGSSETEDRA